MCVTLELQNSARFTDTMKTGPAIDGLHDFAGTLLHSANWDTCERYAADGTVPS